MNKCILCTFFKMIWNGLWNNVCPSIDKKKEEKKTPTFKILGETILFSIIFIAVVGLFFFIVYLIFSFIPWLAIGIVMFWFLFSIGVMSLPFIGWGIIKTLKESAKVRIDCIKAYWRKAKEDCE